MIDIACLLFLVLAFTDFLYTRFMLGKYGTHIEMNPLIPVLTRYLGLDRGLALGILGPTLLWCWLGQHFHPFIETLLFGRLMLFLFQAHHLRIELALSERSRTASRREIRP